MKKSATLAEKLTRDTVAHSSGCHVWVGLKNHKGYGRISHGKKRLGAHRVAHELHIGPIPTGFHVDHLCGNRACVNPAHLEAVTPAENNARSDSPSGRNARATHCKRGHLFTAESTHFRPNGSRLCAICYPRGKRWMKPSGSPPEAAVGATAALAGALVVLDQLSDALFELQERAEGWSVSGVYFTEPCFSENVEAIAKAEAAERARAEFYRTVQPRAFVAADPAVGEKS